MDSLISLASASSESESEWQQPGMVCSSATWRNHGMRPFCRYIHRPDRDANCATGNLPRIWEDMERNVYPKISSWMKCNCNHHGYLVRYQNLLLPHCTGLAILARRWCRPKWGLYLQGSEVQKWWMSVEVGMWKEMIVLCMQHVFRNQVGFKSPRIRVQGQGSAAVSICSTSAFSSFWSLFMLGLSQI